MPEKKTPQRSKLLHFVTTFAIVYLVTTVGMRFFFPEKFNGEPADPVPLTLGLSSGKIPVNRNLEVIVENRTGSGVALSDRCPEPPVIIERVIDDRFYQMDLKDPVLPCSPLTELSPRSRTVIDLSPWKYAAFKEEGTYRISLPLESTRAVAGETIIGAELRVTNSSIVTSLFRAFISKPLLNGLVLIASLIPGHNLGLAIILLTILVRLLLYFPSQHALQSQKKLQTLQPKLDEIKRKYAGDQQKITQETMALWKHEKINPFQSCLPTLIQIPILIGLYSIIRDSGAIELARHLLYPPFLSLDWSFHTFFLGLDLHYIPFKDLSSWIPTPTNIVIVLRNCALPLIISVLQFLQMKLAFARKKKVTPKEKKPLAERLDSQTMMMYMLPIMIFFISGGMPAAISLYWGTSTLFGIAQQMIVNRKK